MGIEIRHAIPDDAEAIHRLTSNYQARVRGGKRAEQAAGMASVDQLRHRIERSASKMQRMVALGDRARLLAVLQAGSWNTDRENEFASTRWRRFLNGLKAEWPDHWGCIAWLCKTGLLIATLQCAVSWPKAACLPLSLAKACTLRWLLPLTA